MAKKITKANTAPLGLYALRDLPKGEYVRRVDVCKACKGEGKLCVYGAGYNGDTCGYCDGKGYTKEYSTTWIKGDYCRSFPDAGKYELTDFYNTEHVVYRHGSVLVLAGFTF